MTDRELLERAALAAGHPQGRSSTLGGLLTANDLYWNPLSDDGDRYRLARTMKLIVDFDAGEVRWYPRFTGQNVIVQRALQFATNGGEARTVVLAAAMAGE